VLENSWPQSNRFPGGDQEQAFAALLTYIRRERSMECSQYKDSFLRRRLAVRMTARGIHTYQDYLGVLRADPAEIDALLAALSINVSRFFRDVPVFDALRHAVLAPLLAERAQTGQCSISVWSAGCASGEEPYSVAIILKELLKEKFSSWNVTIRATDVDARVLARAQRALFTASSFRDLQADYVQRYFSVQGSTYTLQPEIRQAVTFEQHDLTSHRPLPGYDLILCRNVLIYFARQHQSGVVQQLVEHLRPGGYLVLGMVEMVTMGMTVSGRLKAVDGRLRIYRKRD